MSRFARLATATASAVVLAGCTSEVRIFDGYHPDVVWQAMVTAAHEPRYPDWKVTANDVWVDEARHRIEVLRLVRRVYFQPTAPPHHEDRTWRFEMRLQRSDPPEAKFVSRGFGMPTEAQSEALRFFADVEHLLLKLPPEPHPAAAEADRSVMDSVGIDDERPEPAGQPGEP
jgi:hypothetical protein